jgi:hypothetical protein
MKRAGGWVVEPAEVGVDLPPSCSLNTQNPLCAFCHCLQAAVDSLTRSLGLEWGHYGIRTAGVAPGPIEGTAGERCPGDCGRGKRITCPQASDLGACSADVLSCVPAGCLLNVRRCRWRAASYADWQMLHLTPALPLAPLQA